MRIRRLLALVLCGCATAPVGTALVPVPEIAPIPVAGRITDTVVFVGIDFSAVSPRVGGRYDGWLKIYQGPIDITQSTANSWAQNARDAAQHALQNAGYRVRVMSAMFDQLQSYTGVKFAIAGKATALRIDSYGNLAGGYTDASVAIQWELFDVASRNVILSTSTSGASRTAGTSGDAIMNALRISFTTLLAYESLVAAIERASSPPRRALPSMPNVAWRRALPRDTDLIEIGSQDQLFVERATPLETASLAVVALRGSSALGSAFVVTRDGLALTNLHVVQDQRSITARFKDGTERPVRLVRTDSVADLALVQIHCPSDCFTVSIAPLGLPSSGTDVYAIGTPVSEILGHSVTKGIVSGARRAGSITLIQTDAAVSPGNSGGPLIEARSGRAIGVVSLKLVRAGVEGIAFAIALDDALRTLGVVVRGAR